MKSIEEKEQFVRQVINCLMGHEEINLEKAEDMVKSALRDPTTLIPELEYRFMGSLGFGGKLRIDSWRGAVATMYPEDETPKRRVQMDRINKDLRDISDRFGFRS